MAELRFLGTGNFLAPGARYWNSFVLDGSVLVEPSPTALPNLRRAGLGIGAIDVVVISHFHADHTFGWPFLLLEVIWHRPSSAGPFFVVGPPGVASFLDDMLTLGGLPNIQEAVLGVDVRYVEAAPGEWQSAGRLRFRAVDVEHVEHLRCFGYLFATEAGGDRVIGYSGDTRPCAGLTELASSSDVLVLECNGAHPPAPVPVTHMDVESVRALRAAHPSVPFVLTHLGDGVDAEVAAAGIADVVVPRDLEKMDV